MTGRRLSVDLLYQLFRLLELEPTVPHSNSAGKKQKNNKIIRMLGNKHHSHQILILVSENSSHMIKIVLLL